MLAAAVLPRSVDPQVGIRPLRLSTAEDLLQSHQVVIASVASAKITLAQGAQIAGLLESHRRFIETHELVRRIEALEQNHPK